MIINKADHTHSLFCQVQIHRNIIIWNSSWRVFSGKKVSSLIQLTSSVKEAICVKTISESRRGPKGASVMLWHTRCDCSHSPTLCEWYSWLLINGHASKCYSEIVPQFCRCIFFQIDESVYLRCCFNAQLRYSAPLPIKWVAKCSSTCLPLQSSIFQICC